MIIIIIVTIIIVITIHQDIGWGHWNEGGAGKTVGRLRFTVLFAFCFRMYFYFLCNPYFFRAQLVIMASGDSVEAGKQAIEDIDGSVLAGSEESFTHECDTCKLDGQTLEAKYYCGECNDFLCESCETYHKRVKATRFHEILTGDRMPAKVSTFKTGRTPEKQHRMMDKCICNQEREVEVYCSDHDDVFCSVCKNVLHKHCQIYSLEESSAKIQMFEVFKTTSEKVGALVEKAIKLQMENKENISKLQQVEINCKDEIKNVRVEVNLLLDKLEVKALDDLQQQVGLKSKLLMDKKETIESTVELLESDKRECDEVKRTNDKRQMFVTSVKIKKMQPKYELALAECDNTMICPRVTFKRNESLMSLKTLGTISSSNLLDAEIKAHRTIDVKQHSDEKPPWITGVAFMPNGELLIADHFNNRITMFDRTIKMIESTKCPGQPYDIVVVNENEAIVTLSDKCKLLYVHIDSNLTFGRSIELNSSCYGVTLVRDELYVAVYANSVIEVHDKLGNSVRTVGKNEIVHPYFIASNSQGDKLFISEEKKLVCLTSTGAMQWSYSDKSLRTSRKVFVDSENNLLVCDPESNNIHVLKADGTKHKELLTQATKISKPYSIDCRATDGFLAVGDWNKGQLHILELR